MTKYLGGHAAQSGYYWNAKAWSIAAIPAPGGVLPGGAQEKYLRVPLLAVFLLMPLLGGLFVVFLPFIGFALFFYAIVRKLAGGAKKGAEELAATVTPGWVPGEAHMTGKRPEERPAEGAPAADARIDELAKEIEEKRKA